MHHSTISNILPADTIPIQMAFALQYVNEKTDGFFLHRDGGSSDSVVSKPYFKMQVH